MPVIRILVPCPPRTNERAWGDYYFCESLGESFKRAGVSVRFSYAHKRLFKRVLDYIHRVFKRDEVELSVRGKDLIKPAIGKMRLLWLISQPDALALRDLRAYDHVFVASPKFHDRIAPYCKSSSILFQCTDATRFTPNDVPGTGNPLFVGNRRTYAQRPIVAAALDAGCTVDVWGKGWESLLPPGVLKGIHIQNIDLPKHYGAATVILNDHVEDMWREGFVSNRVYDALACATPILTEEMSGIPEDIKPVIDTYSDLRKIGHCIKTILERGEADRDSRLSTAEHVRCNHSFDNRVAEIKTVVRRQISKSAAQTKHLSNAH